MNTGFNNTITDKASVISFTNYRESVAKAFDEIEAGAVLADKSKILVKPNLVDDIPYPVTTPVACVEAIIDYIRSVSNAGIIVAEGSGGHKPTTEVFRELGYTRLAEQKQVRLVDLNEEPLTRSENPLCKIFREYYIPKIAMEYFIISVPVLKAHSFSEVTLSLKNMMGFAPPSHYQLGGFWKKSFFHNRIHDSIIEMNMHRMPDLTLLDATTGMPDYHLGGSHCNPPVNKIVASLDALEADKTGAGLLGFDWNKIRHLADFKSRLPV
jgi:uncharacterized protein (DUF362 family)